MQSFLWEYYDQPSSQRGRRQRSVIFAKKKFPVLVGTTSGLKKHLRVHPDLLEEYLLKQVDREKELKGVKRLAEDQPESKPLKQIKLDFGAKEVTKAKQVDFDEALVNFVAETGVSFNVIGHQSFKDLIGVVNRNINVKSSRTVSRKVKDSASSVLSGSS